VAQPAGQERARATRSPAVDDAASGRRRAAPLLVLLVPTLLLSAVAAGAGTLPGDPAIARALQAAADPPAGGLARFADGIGSLPAVLAVAMVAALAFAATRRFAAAAFVLAAAAVRGLNPLLKQVLESPRPTEAAVRVTEQATGYGFPSGHAMGVTLVFGALLLAAGASPLPGPVRRCAIVGTVAVVAVTGFGRVFTGAHWPSDVAGGILWGVTILLALRLVFWQRRPRAAWPGRRGERSPVAEDGTEPPG